MKRRCKDSIFIKKLILKILDLRLDKYRAADIEPKNLFYQVVCLKYQKVMKKLDVYEDYPILYKKYYFLYYGKK